LVSAFGETFDKNTIGVSLLLIYYCSFGVVSKSGHKQLKMT